MCQPGRPGGSSGCHDGSPGFDAFERDVRALGLETVEHAPRATDHIPAMAGMIHDLERNGHTYTTDGSIYFKISTFPEYGKLARLDHGGIKSGARVDSDK